MKLTIGNDLHLGSKHATHTWEDFLDVIEVFPNTILNGDIFDFANCKRSEVELWRQRARHTLQVVEANGGHYILGNHSLEQVAAPNFVMVDGIYLTHGDLGFLWRKEKALEYRSKAPGAGFFKRNVTPLYDVFRRFKPFKPTQMFYDKCDEVIAEFNPRAIVLGHFHPPSNIIFDYKGVKCYILKRGIQEIEI